MNPLDHDIVFAPDPELKEHWLDGWAASSAGGRTARGLAVAGLAGALLLMLIALFTVDFGAVAREAAGAEEGVELAHLTFMCVGAGCFLVLAVVALLCLRRFEGSAGAGISNERLTIDAEGFLTYVRRDERELIDTGDDRYFWGRVRQPRSVRVSVAYLPGCEFYLLDEYRELVIMPLRAGSVRERRFASEQELETSGALRSRLNVGRSTPEDLAADSVDDRELGIELFPYFSPDLVGTLRELGVPEGAPRLG